MNAGNYLSVRDVAKLLSVSKTTIRTYINKGYLQARKIGSWNRISRASVDQFLNSLTQNQTPTNGTTTSSTHP